MRVLSPERLCPDSKNNKALAKIWIQIWLKPNLIALTQSTTPMSWQFNKNNSLVLNSIKCKYSKALHKRNFIQTLFIIIRVQNE